MTFSWTGVGLCIYHLFVWSNFNFLHNSQWITLPTQSYLVLYSYCANLQHSLIMWLMVSSLSPHKLHFMFCLVLSILALIWWILIALFSAAIRRDSVCLLRFPFFSHVHVFLFESSVILALNVHRVVFHLIYVFWLLSFRWSSCIQYCFCWVSPIRVSLFFLLFLTHIICHHHLWDVMPYAWSLVFSFSGPFKFFSGPLQECSRISYEEGQPMYFINPCEFFTWALADGLSWWSFTGVWITASLFKSLGLFSVVWQILKMLLFG